MANNGAKVKTLRHYPLILFFHSFIAIFNCWEADPIKRPKFAHLVMQLNCLLELEADYLELEVSHSPENPMQLEIQKTDSAKDVAEV